ncbi:MAG TPA: hypothetical protein VHZ98_07455 [Galbitalea sp.]|jgi:hypothetical protein|nr:hypothetical protein [Galbitalea sp.]
MRRAVRTATAIIFTAIVLGCGFAILYLGTSTGLTFGGSGTEILQSSKGAAVYAEVGWLRNTAPWPITIQSITTNVVNSSDPPTVYLEREQSGAHVSSGSLPNWALNAERTPYQIDGGALRLTGFAVQPAANKISYLTSITVHFSGPLGLQFVSTFGGTDVAAASSILPAGVLANDPAKDSSSLNGYITALRQVLLDDSPTEAAAVMGNGATEADGSAFLAKETGFVTTESVVATPAPKDARLQTVLFYNGDRTTGAMAPISVSWSGYQWTVVRS